MLTEDQIEFLKKYIEQESDSKVEKIGIKNSIEKMENNDEKKMNF